MNAEQQFIPSISNQSLTEPESLLRMNVTEILQRRVNQFLTIVIVSAVLTEVFDLQPIFLELVVSLAVGRVFGGITATIVVALGGDVLDDIRLAVHGVSISGFTVVTFIVGRILF